MQRQELITSHRNGSQPVANSERIGEGGAEWSRNITINPWRCHNNLPFGAQVRRRRKEKVNSDFSFLSSDAETMAFAWFVTQQSTHRGVTIQTIYVLEQG